MGLNLDLLDTYTLFRDPATRFHLAPTAIELKSFTAEREKKSVILNWESATEYDNLGFNLNRVTTVDGERTKLNNELISTGTYSGSLLGVIYT